MPNLIFYSFNGDVYDYASRDEMLENIRNAIETEAYSDKGVKSHKEVEEIVSASFDGTHYQMDLWSNLLAITQMCPYELGIRKFEVTVEPSGGPELTENENFQVAQHIEDSHVHDWKYDWGQGHYICRNDCGQTASGYGVVNRDVQQ